jgi:glycosyltransferase involved in cell wall biosynthesis
MKKPILFISLDYPPKGGPGAKRNFYLKQHLSQLGWETKVLTISATAKQVDSSNITDDKDIIRAIGKDATEVFSIAGKYPKIIEIPDRWYLWIIPALIKGYKLCKKRNFDFIYAGFPTYSSVIVGLLLSKMLSKALVVDLRDPFRFRYDGINMPTHWLYKFIEKSMVNQASKILTTTPECAQYYKDLYPNFPKQNFHIIHNGYSQEFHQTIKKIPNTKQVPFILLHSGILYKIGRNPEILLQAIKLLISQDVIKPGEFILRFRGANIWQSLKTQIIQLDLTHYIEFKGTISYPEAIAEMQSVDANVLIQNSLFNLQIPSKLYDI